MKTKSVLIATTLLLSTLNSQFSTVFAQGALTPPGVPAPTMKSLAQIEPRTPISSAPFIISTGGSYYLTTNVTVSSGDAITIAANDVTLDLNGFTISSTAPSAAGTAILLAGVNLDITILNGHIKGRVTNSASGTYGGGGFVNGIDYSTQLPQAVRVSGVSVSGCLTNGIHLNIGNATVIDSCTAQSIGYIGIYASSVTRSTVSLCGFNAIVGYTISDCSGFATGSGNGVNGVNVNNCYGESTGSGFGIGAGTANGCKGVSSDGTGMIALTANNCQGTSTTGTGLNAGRIAFCCTGMSSTGTGLTTLIANSCYGSSVSAVNKYNMP
jgi:hypothetical protein